MDMTIEQYAEFISSLMHQAEEEDFEYELDFIKIRTSGKTLSEKGSVSDQATG